LMRDQNLEMEKHKALLGRKGTMVPTESHNPCPDPRVTRLRVVDRGVAPGRRALMQLVVSTPSARRGLNGELPASRRQTSPPIPIWTSCAVEIDRGQTLVLENRYKRYGVPIVTGCWSDLF